MKLSITSTLIIITAAILSTFSFGTDIEGQLFKMAIAKMQSMYGTIIIPEIIPKIIYLSREDLVSAFSETYFTTPDGIRGFCTMGFTDKIYVDKDLDKFLLHSTILHEFTHILQFLNPRGACLTVERQGGILKCDEEELSNCIFYMEMRAYLVEESYYEEYNINWHVE